MIKWNRSSGGIWTIPNIRHLSELAQYTWALQGHKQRNRGNMGINGFYQRFDQAEFLLGLFFDVFLLMWDDVSSWRMSHGFPSNSRFFLGGRFMIFPRKRHFDAARIFTAGLSTRRSWRGRTCLSWFGITNRKIAKPCQNDKMIYFVRRMTMDFSRLAFWSQKSHSTVNPCQFPLLVGSTCTKSPSSSRIQNSAWVASLPTGFV